MSKNEQLLNDYENLNLRKLPPLVKRIGYEFHLVERTDKTLLYKQVDIITKKTHAYEVFKNKISRGFIANTSGPDLYFVESFPKAEEFGKRAWTYPTLELAKEKYNALEV